MLTFEFATAARIVFGAGRRREAGAAVQGLGRRALVVTGATPARADWLVAELRAGGVDVCVESVTGEPALTDVERALARGRAERRDVVIGIGGGSALDTAKAVAALMTSEGPLLDYLEVIGKGRPLPGAGVPCVAIPTTAGTGSEVTRNAVLTSPAHRAKVSLRSAFLLPRVALVDPELTHDVPRDITAATGLDALTQLVEAYVCVRATPLTDGFCVEGMRRAARSLRRVVADGCDSDARADMALASLLSGLALANAGLGAAHGLAAPVGGRFGVHHGVACAALLPGVMRVNLAAIRARAPGSEAERRFVEVARVLTGQETASAEDGVEWVRQLRDDLGIPGLATFGVMRGDLESLAAAALATSSMRGNPVTLGADEVVSAAESAL